MCFVLPLILVESIPSSQSWLCQTDLVGLGLGCCGTIQLRLHVLAPHRWLCILCIDQEGFDVWGSSATSHEHSFHQVIVLCCDHFICSFNREAQRRDFNSKRFKELANKVKKSQWKQLYPHVEGATATACSRLELTTNFIVWSSAENFSCGNAFRDSRVKLHVSNVCGKGYDLNAYICIIYSPVS